MHARSTASPGGLGCALFTVAAALAGCASTPAPGIAPAPTATTVPAAIACTDDARWDDPATPLRVHGNTWYVGTCGITALLVTSEDGHVLLDAATDRSGGQVVAKIRALGFDPADVRAIVLSHEHVDHAGGLSEVQRATGAPVFARAAAAATLLRGDSDAGDPQFGSLRGFPPVARVRVIADDEVVRVGPLALQAIPTPGHTPGGTSWSWNSCDDDGRCARIVYADSLTAISGDGWRFSDEAAHPGYVAAFRASLDRVAALDCDLLLTPHPSASALWQRIGPRAERPAIDPGACRAYAAAARQRLESRVADEERAGAGAGGTR